MRIFVVDGEGRGAMLSSLGEAEEGDYRLLWVDTEGFGVELEEVRSRFGLHPVVFSQAGAAETPPKLQEFDGYLYMVWDMLRDRPETEDLEVEPLHLVLGRDYLVTAHRDGMEELDRLAERVLSSPARFTGPVSLLYQVLEEAVDDYHPAVAALGERIDGYIDDLVSGREGGDLARVLSLKHHNMHYRRVAYLHRDIVLKLTRREQELVPDEWAVYLVDVYDRLSRVVTEVEYNGEQVAAALDIHLNAVSNRLNHTMKRLTAVATFFMPATFLVGLYGMNFEYMPEYAWRYGYVFFWAVLAVITVAMVWIGRRQDWY